MSSILRIWPCMFGLVYENVMNVSMGRKFVQPIILHKLSVDLSTKAKFHKLHYSHFIYRVSSILSIIDVIFFAVEKEVIAK